jgi:hypothetical protein
MCYDVKTSLAALTVGLASAVALFVLRRPILGTLVFTYVLMQLAEAMIWYGIDTHDVHVNRKGVDLASINVSIHALVVGLAIYAFKKTHLWSYGRRVALLVLTVIAIVLMLMGIHAKRHMAVVKPSICSSSSCRLRWDWDYRDEHYNDDRVWDMKYPLQVVVIIAMLYTAQIQDLGYIMFFFGILVVLAYAITPKGPTRIHASVTTTWCMITAFGAPLLVLWAAIRNHTFIK